MLMGEDEKSFVRCVGEDVVLRCEYLREKRVDLRDTCSVQVQTREVGHAMKQ